MTEAKISEMEKVTVSAKALHQLLQSLVGSPHEIRELQVTREVWKDNPLNILIEEFNAAVDAHNSGEVPTTPV